MRPNWTRSDSISNVNLGMGPSQGGEARLITNTNNAFDPLWWPDGKSLATITTNHIWRFPISGSPPETLTKEKIRRLPPHDLRWSSDKTQIYFQREYAGKNIWGYSVKNGAIRQLTNCKNRRGFLGRSFATDGTYIYFTWQEHKSDIWVMDVEQGD